MPPLLPPVGASVCPPIGVYSVRDLALTECYYRDAELIAVCQYNAQQVIGPPNPSYPFAIEVTSINWTGGGGTSILPSQVVNNDTEANQAVLDMVTAILEGNNFLAYPLAVGTDYRYNGGIPNNGYFTKLTVSNVDLVQNPLLDYTIEINGVPTVINFGVTGCVGLQLENELWTKIVFTDGQILWFDNINCVFGTPLPGLIPCPTSNVDIEYQPVCVDGTTQLTRADLWQDGSLLSSFYLDASGATVPAPIGDVVVGSCPVPTLTECYYKRVSASCLYRSNIVINPPSPVYPFDIHVTELNWVGGGGLAVLPPQTVNDDTEANAAVKAMIEAIVSANGLIGYPVNANPNLFYIGGIPNNGYRAIVEIENVDQSNAIIDYTIDIGGTVITSNFSEISCNNVPIDPQEYWKKIVYPDGSIVWWDSVNCVFGDPPDGLVLCGSEVNFIGRSKELGAGETWAITTDVGGILQSVTFNILSGTGQYIDLPTLTPTTYPIGNWSWGVNGAIDNENLLVGTMTVGIGGSMIVQWTERV